MKNYRQLKCNRNDGSVCYISPQRMILNAPPQPSRIKRNSHCRWLYLFVLALTIVHRLYRQIQTLANGAAKGRDNTSTKPIAYCDRSESGITMNSTHTKERKKDSTLTGSLYIQEPIAHCPQKIHRCGVNVIWAIISGLHLTVSYGL